MLIDKAIKSQNPRPGTAVETKKNYDYIIPMDGDGEDKL